MTVQVLPFSPDDVVNSSDIDLDALLLQRFPHGKTTYRLFKIGSALNGSAYPGLGLISTTDGSGTVTAVTGANLGGDFAGIVHPNLTKALSTNDYVLLQVEGDVYWHDDAGADVVQGAAVGTNTSGQCDAGATTTSGVCLTAAPAYPGSTDDIALVHLYAPCEQLGA